ncbi:DNA-3-methyladenine glycosylase family protein [Scatolibacter rhodanostii]|uniref:DNA-3-methyladenine glycosylase family protein n=1 Tax=Scatolibacter rhodanostii TaxID=2014781 RepID=UPI000C084315|nr:DNA glycosylase [Scatolibacter rhodanostii]
MMTKTGIQINKCFDLEQTLNCGQSFRWKEIEKTEEYSIWEGIAFGRLLQIRQDEDELTFFCSQQDYETVWYDYFDLAVNYEEMRETLAKQSEPLKEATKFAPGIRILRQDAWEALASFLFSQNNNIPRIKGIIERFAELCGEPIDGGFTFPAVETVAKMTVKDLEPIRAGFRAKYIIAAARAIVESKVDLQAIREKDIHFGRYELQKIHGVGPKVAECTLLYGFHKTEAFPLDVWMKRAMNKLFPGKSPEEFGKHAGLAQQYIFHYSRMHAELFQTPDT